MATFDGTEGAGGLDRRMASDIVVQQLQAAIQRGDLAPGTRLRQGEIAERFGVSTTPVREAFAILQARGLVFIDPHRGAIVFTPTIEDLRESYEIREVLESLALEKAMPHVTPELIADLEGILDQMERGERGERWLGLNNDFHMRLYAAAQRPRLLRLINGLRVSCNVYIHMFITHEAHEGEPEREHRELLEACKRGNLDAALTVLHRHLRGTLERMLDLLSREGGPFAGSTPAS
jgi:DNA-binding GntR family transcriptional regulator